VSEYETEPYGNTEIVADAIDTIHEQGLRVVLATNLGGVFAGINTGVYHLLHPEIWVQDPLEGTIQKCCFNNTAFLSYTKVFYEKLFDKFKIDGIAFDEPHRYKCVCEDCCRKFSETIGGDLGKVDQSTCKKFAEDSAVKYISLISRLAKERHLSTSCIVNDFKSLDYHAMLCSLKDLDILGPDPYWFHNKKDVKWVGEITKTYKRICEEKGKDCLVVIQGFNVPSGREQEIYEAGKITAANGADILCGWYHWRGTQNPELTWDTTLRMLNDFGKRRYKG